MPSPLTETELLEIHAKLLEKQRSLEPVMTIKLMMETLRYSSPNSIQNILPKLISMGLVTEKQHGQVKKYRILEKK